MGNYGVRSHCPHPTYKPNGTSKPNGVARGRNNPPPRVQGQAASLHLTAREYQRFRRWVVSRCEFSVRPENQKEARTELQASDQRN